MTDETRLRNAFQELVRQYYQRSRSAPYDEPPQGRGVTLQNRTCGDRVTVYLPGESRVEQVYAKVDGCSLCHAAARIAADLVSDRDRQESLKRLAAVRSCIHSGQPAFAPDLFSDEEVFKLRAFEFLKEYPGRSRCVDLPFEAFLTALESVDRG